MVRNCHLFVKLSYYCLFALEVLGKVLIIYVEVQDICFIFSLVHGLVASTTSLTIPITTSAAGHRCTTPKERNSVPSLQNSHC